MRRHIFDHGQKSFVNKLRFTTLRGLAYLDLQLYRQAIWYDIIQWQLNMFNIFFRSKVKFGLDGPLLL